MNAHRFSVARNPFTRGIFGVRQRELRAIYRHLQSDPPQSCVLIGESYSGRTMLLNRLIDAREPFILDELIIRQNYTFVYFDCKAYDDPELAEKGAYASMLFWWELYDKLYTKLWPKERKRLSKPSVRADCPHLENAFEIKFEVEDIIRSHLHHVVIILDNFEGVARLPLRDSEWLRSLGQLSCSFIAASRHLLHLLYQNDLEGQWRFSPLWNLFSDPIYLGLMDENDVQAFLLSASETAKKLESLWSQEDINFIKKMAGRHPELIRIVCMYLFEHRISAQQQNQEQDLLEFNIMRDAQPICMRLWSGLDDQELRAEFPLAYARSKIEYENQELSPYQAALLDIIYGKEVVEKNALFILEQRGLIEYRSNKWQIFSEILKRFVCEKNGWPPLSEITKPVDGVSDQRHTLSFSYLEGKVYDYLYSRLGQVCDKGEIKNAVWQTNAPSDSALQKIIERVREKIEHEAESTFQLVAVRRKGYMLRPHVLENE